MIQLYVLEKWNTYRREVIKTNAGPVQVRETRKAFYAGIAVAVQMVGTAMEETGEIPMTMMKQMMKEVIDFTAEVSNGPVPTLPSADAKKRPS